MSPFTASRTSIWHRRSSRSAYIFVNPGGICCTITMAGISAGRRFITSRVASVPPVEAPRPIMYCCDPLMGPTVAGTGSSGTATAPTLAGRRTFAWEASITASVRERTNSSRLCTPSGLRTKPTAPACSASKTRRFSDDASTTGSGCWGSIFFINSMPVIPGICTSQVITSGFRDFSLFSASIALMA